MLIVLTFHGWKAHCEHDYEIYSGAFSDRNMAYGNVTHGGYT